MSRKTRRTVTQLGDFILSEAEINASFWPEDLRIRQAQRRRRKVGRLALLRRVLRRPVFKFGGYDLPF